MGDCGQYSADVSIQYSLKKKTKNTEEDSLAFITKKNFEIHSEVEASEKEIQNLYENKIDFEMNYRDWENWQSSNTSLQEMLEAFEEYYEDELYSITIHKKATAKDIEYLDLNLAKDISTIYSDFTITEEILSVYESIYCENDNSSDDSVKVNSKKIAELLAMPEASIVLSGDGSGNC